MASTPSSLVVLILLFQAWYAQSLEIELEPPLKELHERLFRPSTDKVKVDIGIIKQALLNANNGHNYSIMSYVVELNLATVVPNGDYDKDGTLTIFNNNTITIFAPVDRAFSDEYFVNNETFDPKVLGKLMRFGYHVVITQVDKESFDSKKHGKGDQLLTCDADYFLLVSDVPNNGGNPSINKVRIIEWNIYNEGNLLVHGIENLFIPNIF